MSIDPQRSAIDEILEKINEIQQDSGAVDAAKKLIEEHENPVSPEPDTVVDQDLFDEIKDKKSKTENKSVLRRFIDGEEDDNDDEDELPTPSALYDDIPEDIEDFDNENDRDEIYRDLKNIVGKMAVKSFFLFLISLASLYLFTAGFYPVLFGGSVDNTWFRMAMLTVDVLCVAVSGGIFMEGLKHLLRAKADTDTLLALLWLSITFVRVFGLIKPDFFPHSLNLEPMLALGLMFNVSAKKKIANNIKKNFKYISIPSEKLSVSVPASCETNNALILETEEGGDVMYAHETNLVSEYIKHSYSDFEMERSYQRFLFVTVILVFLGSILLSQLVGVGTAVLFPASAFAISVPFFARAYYAQAILKNGNKIRKNGGILTSAQSAKELEDADLLVISEEDFLGKDSVLLQGVKAMGDTKIDDLITNIAALFNEVGTPLKPLFLKMIDTKSVQLPRVDDIYYHEGMGYTCLIHSKMFLVGNYRLMEHFNIEFPENLKNLNLQTGRFPVFVAYQKFPAGIFIASYEYSKETERAIQIAEDERVGVGIVSNNFLFGEELLKTLYPTTHPELFHFISLKTGSECKELLKRSDKSPDLIASVSGPKGLFAALYGSSKLLTSLKINRFIRILYTLISLALIFFIALSSYSANTAFQILAFQVIWMLPVCAICTFCK